MEVYTGNDRGASHGRYLKGGVPPPGSSKRPGASRGQGVSFVFLCLQDLADCLTLFVCIYTYPVEGKKEGGKGGTRVGGSREIRLSIVKCFCQN